MARLTGSLQVDGNISANSFTGSVQGTATTSSHALSASYVDANNVDGEVYEAERARRIEVGSYGSYSNLTDIPFVTGDYGNSVKRISADGVLQWHAGTNHLTVPGVDATTLTGSLDWDQLENVPDGIMSSSDGVIPDGTVSSSAQTISNLNSTGILSGSISNITIKEQNGNNTYPLLFANTSNPNGDFQGEVAYSQITGGTERIRFNPSTGLLTLGNLVGSGSITAYGTISSYGGDIEAGRAVNTYFLSLRNNVSQFAPGLTSLGADNYWTLTATGSRDDYKIPQPNHTQGDMFWSYKTGGWTRVLTEQNVASGSATLTQVWVNGLVTGSTAEFTTISGSTISGSFIGDGSGLTGLSVDSVDYDNVTNKPTLISSSAQINFDTDPINIAIGGTSLGSAYRLLRGNVAVGAKAYECVTNICDLEQNVAIGLCAGRSIDSDSVNSVFIGTTAGGDTSACQNSNIGIGTGAHSCGGGTGNVSIGSVAGQDTTGNYNIAIGFTAARDNVGGHGNVVIGGNAGRCLTGNGSYHVLLGYNTGGTAFFNENQFSTSQSGSVFAVNVGTGNEPLIHSRFGAWGGVKDYLQINAPTSASSFEAASLTGSLDFSDVNNKPTLFSGSSQVDFNSITNVPDELVSASNGDVTINGDLDVTGTTSGSFIGDGSGLTGVSVDSVTSASFASKAGSLEKFENVQSVNGQHALLMTFASESAGQSNGRAGFAGTNTSQGSLRFNPNRSGDGSTAELSIGASGVTGILDVDRIDMGSDIIINDGVINLLGVQNGGSIAFSDVSDPSSQNTGHLWRDGTELYFGKSTNDKSKVVTDSDDILKISPSDPLPTGAVGNLAVSASALYFHNGSNWSQIS